MATAVLAKAQGNPFFLEELAWAMAYRGDRNGSCSTIPATVQAVLVARIDQLSRDDKELLQTASVIGPQAPLTLLRAAGGYTDDVVDQTLVRLQAAELLYERLEPHRVYSFKHTLTQDVAYGSLLETRPRELHGKTAQALEEDFSDITNNQPELLAHHYEEAGVLEAAIDYWCHAGQRASERSANEEANQHLCRGLG